MAIALIPLAGLMGGGIDMSRMYITKTRLQHACDAGALAGRKAMGGGIWTQSNGMPNATAVRFFDANFPINGYGTRNLTKTFTESAGKVSGTASVELQMTLVKVVTKDWAYATLSVNCDAEMRLPNTDVMFVLDNTGSMGDTLSGDNASKLTGLKVAVKCFYEIVARENTNADCDGGEPSGGVGSQVQVRFGFVPYDMNVNVGKLLPSGWFASSWTYQSREQSAIYGTWNNWLDDNNGNPVTRNVGGYSAWADYGTAVNANSSSACNSALSIPGDQYTSNGTANTGSNESDTQFRAYTASVQSNYQRSYNSTTKRCVIQVRTRSLERRATYNKSLASTNGAVAVPAWLYKPKSIDFSAFKSGNGWATTTSLTLPIGDNFTNKTVTWDGCVEERETVRQATYSPIPAGAKDLDIDSTPSTWDVTTQWKPALTDVEWVRRTNYSNSSAYNLNQVTTFTNYTGKGYSCLKEAKKLQQWPDPGDFDEYVDGLYENGGNTYHDIGLLWGARLLSPTGLFRSENEFASRGGEIERHLIFMTDGDACTSITNYQAYGMAWFDRRQTDTGTAPTEGCTTTGTLTQQVNARTAALCAAVKNKNITLWVIWFGVSNPTIEAQLTSCATTGRFFSARNSVQLQQTFRSIANQISQLRLTK
ncbi:MAG: pilus assembly protein TadG-related protein [Candidatus Sphingomonas phytovorans]|nr:pilus assembly protein TadG-related protein [Sphingomonas sp.]WEK01088.1 MAG: pilus assembly protein TadG-related protein [Sphingomonas sp.]